MTLPPAPTGWLLDLTRSVSRVGRDTDTGIDRVEGAWLGHLLAAPEPVFALVRAAPGFVLLDRGGLDALRARLRGSVPWGMPDAVARLHLRQPPARQQAMADLRRLAMARVWSHGAGALGALLRGRVPAGAVYLNLGHANLAPAVLAGLRTLPGLTAVALLHDTIPLDHPDLARAGMPARFARAVATLAAFDLLLCPSAATATAARPHFQATGSMPAVKVVPLGVTVARPAAEALPPELVDVTARPFFLALGTVEPRKNIGFLLDLWEDMARDQDHQPLPDLVIAGVRGWAHPDLFDRLRGGPLAGTRVHWAPGLSDGAVAHLLSRTRGLLHPSLAEGFGLPPAEAAALGVPVVANPLPALIEALGDYPVYAPVAQHYLWHEAICALGRRTGGQRQEPPVLPTWAAHFGAARACISALQGARGVGQARCSG